MKPNRSSLLAAVIATALAAHGSAQTQNGVLPKSYQANGSRQTQIPFAWQPMRYQQTFQATEILKVIKKPVRFKGLRFRAKQTGNPSMTVTLQLTIGQYTGNASNSFAANLKDSKLVFPKAQITLPVSTAGAWVLSLPFSQDFTWDGKSNIVFDLRIFGNGNQNRPFLYFFDSVANDVRAGIERQYNAKSPNETTASVRHNGSGLVTRFDFQEGVALTFGTGCKGLGGFVPKISANGIPVVGNTSLQVQLDKAKPQVPAVLLWGGSNKKWGAIQLPLDLKPVGIAGCTLFVEPLQIFGTATQGGNAGTGFATVPFGIPPVNLFKGISLYAQWMILDNSQQARILPFSMSDAIQLTIG